MACEIHDGLAQKLAGGWATVESVPGDGTRVTAELPLEARNLDV